MNRKFHLVLLILILLFSGCGNYEKITEAEVVFFEAYATDEDDHTALLRLATEKFADYYDLNYTYYRLTGTSNEKIANAVDLAYNSGARVIVVPSSFLTGIIAIHSEYPDVYFVVMDSQAEEDINNEVSNVICPDFDYYQSGYIAGYLVYASGFERAGILDYENNEDSYNYSLGFAQGVKDGNTGEEDITVNYKMVKDEDDNTISEDIYDNLNSQTDALTYYGDKLYHMIQNYCAKTATSYIGQTDSSLNYTEYYVYYNYENLLKKTYEYFSNTKIESPNVSFGFADNVFQIRYDDKEAFTALDTYSLFISEITDEEREIVKSAERLEDLDVVILNEQ